jgi:hypothetical protein
MAGRSALDPAAASLVFLPGAATGPVGTLPVSAFSCFATALGARWLGAPFAGIRVKGVAASVSSWVRASRGIRAIGSRAAAESVLFLDFFEGGCSGVRFLGHPWTPDCAIKSLAC